MSDKTYIGAGIYAEMTDVGIKLTIERESMAIYLDVMAFCALLRFAIANGYGDFIEQHLIGKGS